MPFTEDDHKDLAPTNSDDSDFDLEEEDEEFPDEDLFEVRRTIRAADVYPLEEARMRNVLILGRSRSGKTTLISVLKDPCHEPKMMSMFADSEGAKFQTFAVSDTNAGIQYTVNVIDTPGLCEIRRLDDLANVRSDEQIMETIGFCLKNEITNLHAFIMTISFESGVGQGDIDSFQMYMEKFYHQDIQVIICVTRAEGKGVKWRKNIQRELNDHPYFSQLLQKSNVALMFTGVLDRDAINETDGKGALSKKYDKTVKARTKMLKKILHADVRTQLLDLPISNAAKIDLLRVFEEQNTTLDRLEVIKDFELSNVHNMVDDFAVRNDFMASKEGFLRDEELMKQFVLIKARMKVIAGMMPKDMKARFIGKMLI